MSQPISDGYRAAVICVTAQHQITIGAVAQETCSQGRK